MERLLRDGQITISYEQKYDKHKCNADTKMGWHWFGLVSRVKSGQCLLRHGNLMEKNTFIYWCVIKTGSGLRVNIIVHIGCVAIEMFVPMAMSVVCVNLGFVFILLCLMALFFALLIEMLCGVFVWLELTAHSDHIVWRCVNCSTHFLSRPHNTFFFYLHDGFIFFALIVLHHTKRPPLIMLDSVKLSKCLFSDVASFHSCDMASDRQRGPTVRKWWCNRYIRSFCFGGRL